MTQPAPVAPPVETTPEGTSTPAEPKTPTTTEKLFPDFFEKDDKGESHITSQRQGDEPPVEPPAPPPAAPEPKPAVPAAAAEPKAPEYLDLSQISGKLVKLKVDGVEMDVPAEEVFKNHQLDRHLTQRGQSLAEQERVLKEMQGELTKLKADNPPPANAAPDVKVTELTKKIETLEATIAPQLKQLQVDQGIAALDRAVRENLGFDDFKAKLPEMQKEIAKNFKDPRNPTEQELAQFDTLTYWYQTYQSLKLRELKGGTPPPIPPVPPAPPAPARNPVLDKKPPMPPPAVEEAGGAPGVGEHPSAWKVRYDAQLKLARESGSEEAWQRVFAMKREKSEA